MYKRVNTIDTITMDDGGQAEPVATLADEYGGVSHWIVDDHCYVLVNMIDAEAKQGVGNGPSLHAVGQEPQRVGRMVPWIYAEALEVLKELPALR